MVTTEYDIVTPKVVAAESPYMDNDTGQTVLTPSQIAQLMYSSTDTLIVCVLMPIVFIIGVVGNSLTVVVFIKARGMQSVTNMLLVNLAIADILFLLISVAPKFYSYIGVSVPLVNDYHLLGEVGCKGFTYLSGVTIAVSCVTILILAVEKYLAIRWYVKFRVYRTTNNVLIVCVVVWLFCLIYMLPDTIYTYTYVVDLVWPESFTNRTSMPATYQVCNACLEDCLFYTVYYQISQVFFLGMLPALLLIYLCILMRLIKTERSSKTFTAKASFQAKKQLIRMLVATTLVFVVCITPYRILAFCFFYNVTMDPSVGYYLLNISRTLTYINSAANPIIYNALCDRYREAFKDTLLACLPKRIYNPADHTNNDANGVTMTTLSTRRVSRCKKADA